MSCFGWDRRCFGWRDHVRAGVLSLTLSLCARLVVVNFVSSFVARWLRGALMMLAVERVFRVAGVLVPSAVRL